MPEDTATLQSEVKGLKYATRVVQTSSGKLFRHTVRQQNARFREKLKSFEAALSQASKPMHSDIQQQRSELREVLQQQRVFVSVISAPQGLCVHSGCRGLGCSHSDQRPHSSANSASTTSPRAPDGLALLIVVYLYSEKARIHDDVLRYSNAMVQPS